MKNLYLLGLAMAGLVALPSYGQVHSFPQPWKTSSAVKVPARLPQSMLKAPSAIDDKQSGLTVYAGERMDESKLRSFIKLKTGVSNTFDRLKCYQKEVGNQQDGITMGASDGKDYYAIFSHDYTYSSMAKFFSKVDMQTGDTTVIRTFTDDEQNRWYGDGVYGDFREALYDMAYDPHTKTFYAMGYGWDEQTTDDGTVITGFTKLYAIDKTTGQYELVKDLDRIYYEFCFDYDGNIYATRPKAGDDGNTAVGTELVKLDADFNEVSAVELKTQWGETFMQANFGTIQFDYTTNTLYWMPAGQWGATSMYKINPETGEYSWANGFMTGNWFTGLYIPYLAADNRGAAAQVSGIDAQADVNGAMADTLKWVNPSKTWGGADLSGLEEVRIYRKKAGAVTTDRSTSAEILSADNADLIATVPADGKLGEPMQYVDNAPLEGFNTYYIVPSRVSGELGVPDSIRCYMGVDVPGAVENAYVQKEGEAIRVTWQAPTKGLNNGYIVEDDVTYKLTRMPDNVVVAENYAGTEFVDNTLGEQQKYYYRIQACNKVGEGATAETSSVMAGGALETPISLKFDSYDDQERWNLYLFNNAYNFYFAGGYDDESHCLIGYTGTYGGQSTIVSPPLKLKGGKSYRIESNLYNYFDGAFNVKVTMGRKSDDISDATVLRDDEDLEYPTYTLTKYEDMFTAPEDGTYYYGLTVSNSDYNVFKFFGMTVADVFDNDLKAFSIDNIIEAVAGTDNKCTVKVRNMGANAQSKYTVKIVCDDEGEQTVVGETSDVPTLKSGETADVNVTFRPLKDGKFNFYAVVELEGDEDQSNNTSAASAINVLEEGSTAWTNIVTSGKSEGVDTHGPVEYYGTYDRMEALYYPSEVNSEGGDIVRIAYPYSGNDNLTDRTAESDVKVYMGYTDINSYETAADGLPADQRTLVYEGTMYLEPGTDNLLTFDLDTPFKYDNTRNLVIIVERTGAVTSSEQFCGVFKVFNKDNWSSGVFRSLQYADNAEYTDGKAQRNPSAPVVYLAINDKATGVSTVKTLGGAFGYDSASGVMTFAKGVKSVSVSTVDGKLVKRASVSGSSKLNLGLAKGLYVVSVVAADGSQSNVKLNVNK